MSHVSQTDSSNSTTLPPYTQLRITKESYPNPLVAQGDDWTRSLVHLAKTAELKCVLVFIFLKTALIPLLLQKARPHASSTYGTYFVRPRCSR